jgi:hypothetical protein
LNDRRIAGNQGRDRSGAAGKIDGLHIEIIFGKNSSVLGHPDYQLVGANPAIAHGDLSGLSRN